MKYGTKEGRFSRRSEGKAPDGNKVQGLSFAKGDLEKIHRCLYSTRTDRRIESAYLCKGDRARVTGGP